MSLEKDYSDLKEKIVERKKDFDSKGNVFSPRFIQIWKTPNVKKNYVKYKKLGLIAIDIDVYSCENTIENYGLDIDLNRIFNKVYS